ncbi:hypothetical protein K7X08_030080 [Anisodus acutangulus]|uniref:Uncharacterized protein n=1 Tax=Anisodus acutangulus TaxID=402998 RepID=A0A9Q1LNA0_9SOLA|nr:hypothetical protein K7X08_030080 [Anisodus acutangulus]
MRTGSGFATTSSTIQQSKSTTIKATFTPPAMVQRSPWHTPVPYLFGGLAAMLGLIAFALLILACSYWKLSSHLRENNENDHDHDTEARESEKPVTVMMPVYEEKIVVIMAGDMRPSYLAKPVLSKGNGSNNNLNKCEKKMEKESKEVVIEVKEESYGESHQEIHGHWTEPLSSE